MFKNNQTGSFADEKLTENYVEMTQEELEWFNKYGSNGFKLTDEGFNINPDYPKELEAKERERLDGLYMTGTDVERAIYRAKGLDFDGIIEFVSENPPEGLDITALKIELKANNFYRGNPYVGQIGTILGFSEKQLDEFFETKDYTVLLPIEEPEPVEPEEPAEENEEE